MGRGKRQPGTVSVGYNWEQDLPVGWCFWTRLMTRLPPSPRPLLHTVNKSTLFQEPGWGLFFSSFQIPEEGHLLDLSDEQSGCAGDVAERICLQMKDWDGFFGKDKVQQKGLGKPNPQLSQHHEIAEFYIHTCTQKHKHLPTPLFGGGSKG